MKPRTLITGVWFTLLLVAKANAENLPVTSGFQFEALQAQADQMSCRHLALRTGQTVANLQTFATVQSELSQASISGELSAYIRQRNGYPVEQLLKEPVYRIRYSIPDEVLAQRLNQSQTTALWGVGSFEVQNPNGAFNNIHYQASHPTANALQLELDVTAADVCVGRRFEVVFFSGCPLEVIRFETDEGPWESPAFVTQWWKCENSTTLSFDLSTLAQTLGKRTL